MTYIEATGTDPLLLGRTGENQARTVRFPCARAWQETYGTGSFQLLHRRAGDAAAYPCSISAAQEDILWPILAADVAKAGEGVCELTYTVGDTVVKSQCYVTVTAPTLTEAGEAPEPWSSWVEQVLSAGQAAQSAAEHYPCIGENGHWLLWDAAGEAYEDSGVSAQGTAGDSSVSAATVTELTGLLKGSGGHIAQAEAGVDYPAVSTTQTKVITDTGGYFTADTVEGALQEIGAELSGINTLLGSGVFS